MNAPRQARNSPRMVNAPRLPVLAATALASLSACVAPRLEARKEPAPFLACPTHELHVEGPTCVGTSCHFALVGCGERLVFVRSGHDEWTFVPGDTEAVAQLASPDPRFAAADDPSSWWPAQKLAPLDLPRLPLTMFPVVRLPIP